MKRIERAQFLKTWKVVPIALGLVVGVVSVGLAAVSTFASDTIVEVRIDGVQTAAFDVDSPVDNQDGGNTYRIVVSGENISDVDVYVDGVYYGTFPVDETGTFTGKDIGQIIIPGGGTPGTSYNVEFVGHPKLGQEPDIIVNRTVNFTVDAPVIDKVDPSTVVGLTGGEITIKGDNFDGATSVKVDGIECKDMKVIDSHTITCMAPKHALGYVDVSVTTPYGTYTKLRAFEYVAPGVPSTGLFRIGDNIVKTFDVFFVAVAAGVVGVAVVYMRRLRLAPVAAKKRSSSASNASVKKTAFKSTRKTTSKR